MSQIGILVALGPVDDRTTRESRYALEAQGYQVVVHELSTVVFQQLYDFQGADFQWFLTELTGREVMMSDKITDVPEIKRIIRALPGPIILGCGIAVNREAVIQDLVFAITYDGESFERGAMLKDWANGLDHPVIGLVTDFADFVDNEVVKALGIDEGHVFYVELEEDDPFWDEEPDFPDFVGPMGD